MSNSDQNQPLKYNPPTNLNELFEAAKPTLRALDTSEFVRRMVSRERALELTGVILDSWSTLVPQLDRTFAPAETAQRKAELARVDTRAWVFYAADLAANENHADLPRKRRLELAARVGDHDRFLFKWAVPLFDDDPELSATLRDISPGTGARDDAEDVLRLVAIYRRHWTTAKGRTPVSVARLDQAEADATAQLDLRRKAASNPAQRLANAAYTLWVRDYDELREMGLYLTRHEGDTRSRFPGVHGARTGSGVGGGVDELDAVDELDVDESVGVDVDDQVGGVNADVIPTNTDATS